MAGQYLARPSEQDDWLAQSSGAAATIEPFSMETPPVGCSLLTMLGRQRKNNVISRIRPKTVRRRRLIDDLESEKKEIEDSYIDSQAQIAKLEAALAERDNTIAKLCKEIAEEKRLRKAESDAVGSRAEQIRLWVNTKVTQLEEENQRLQDALVHAGQSASSSSSPAFLGKEHLNNPHHDYEDPLNMTLHNYADPNASMHDYEEPSDSLRKLFGAFDRPRSSPSPVPPRRSAKPSVDQSKLIVQRPAPLPAPDFKAAENGRPARPPTPDLALLVSPSPNSPHVVRRDKFQFREPAELMCLRRSRSESDLLGDRESEAKPQANGQQKRKMSEAAIPQINLPSHPVKKPMPVPRRSAKGRQRCREASSPPSLEEVMGKQKPAIWPRRRAITDGGLIVNPAIDPSVLLYQNISPDQSPRKFTRVPPNFTNPYAKVLASRNSDDESEEQRSFSLPKRSTTENMYYQLESTKSPVGDGPPKSPDQGEAAIPSMSSDARNSPLSPEFLHPLSAFTSVNTLPHLNDSWTREAAAAEAARRHDYSNVDALVGDGDVFTERDDQSMGSCSHAALPVSSSDSALGTLDKDRNGVATSTSPPSNSSPDPVPKPTRKAPPPPVLPKKAKVPPRIKPRAAKVPEPVIMTEVAEAPLFETVKQNGTLRIRSTSLVQRPTSGAASRDSKRERNGSAEFLVSSDDEKEDRRQQDLSVCTEVTYANARFEVSQSAPSGPMSVLNEPDLDAKRKNIRSLMKQHKLSRNFSSELSLSENSVSGSPPSRGQPRVQGDGSVDTPALTEADLEHSGFLTKQDTKGKAWKRRWFVLKQRELVYYKLKEEQGRRKPEGRLALSQLLAVSREEELSIKISTNSKTHQLTADSSVEADTWLTVLRNVLQTSISFKASSSASYLSRPDCQGWVTRIQDGRAKKCWATLVQHCLFFYLKMDSEAPFADLPLQHCRIAVGSNTCSEETERFRSQLNPPPPEKFTITLYSSDPSDESSQTSLTVSGKEEKDQWLFHLTVACQGFDETDTERIVSMLRDNHHAMLSDFEGDSKVWWKHPVLTHSKKQISQPLTTLPTEDLKTKAVSIFKQIQMFCEVKVEQRGIEYHVAHIQTLLENIYAQPGLCNEVYCQLIRQCSNHPNPTGYEVLQCWRLLLIFMSCGLPKGEKFEWFLQQHIQRHMDFKGGVAVLASSCQRLLHRVRTNGPREHLPSRIEMQCLLLGDLAHTRPILLPVELLDGNRYAVECDAVSLVKEVTDHLSQRLGLRDTLWSGFALFASRPSEDDKEEYLRPTAKICDAVRRVEVLALQGQKGRLAPEMLWRLKFKNWLYFKGLSNQETDMERRLLLFQIHEDVVNGRFPVSEEFAIDMMAHAMQVAQGPCPAGFNSHQRQGSLMHGVTHFYPRKLLTTSTPADIRGLTQRLWVKWDALRQKSRAECLDSYLRMVRRWPFCSASFFKCSIRGSEGVALLLAIQEEGISLLHNDTLDLDHSYRYDQLLTFGGCEGDLMLVVQHQSKNFSLGRSTSALGENLEKGGTRKVLLQMSPTDATAATLTIASYIKVRELQQKALEEAASALGL